MIDAKRLMIVVAHPDDEVLGCGGFIAKLLKETKVQVHVLVLNNGCTFRKEWSEDKARTEFGKAMEMLAGDNLKRLSGVVGSYRSVEFEKHTQKEINDYVRVMMNQFGPDTVLTHDGTDLHKDHRIVHEATMVACRFKEGSEIKNVITFPVISSSDISPKWGFEPNFYIDISEVLEEKIAAMTCYETEFSSMNANRGADAIRTHGRFFGLQSNMQYAEAFRIIRASFI